MTNEEREKNMMGYCYQTDIFINGSGGEAALNERDGTVDWGGNFRGDPSEKGWLKNNSSIGICVS
jgi:hypothetical protein